MAIPSRSAALLAASLAACLPLALAGCEGKKPSAPPAPSSEPASPSAVVAALGLDAGILGDGVDPPAPAGDLKVDIDRFVNVETCVRERANLDPLVGDALKAIGYDTFLRDACRLLEAARDKRQETCDKIDSSALRTRCHAWVAMVAQTPEACPLQFESMPARGHHVTCLAVAGRDPRLCAGEARTVPRATCDALASRDEARCDALSTADRPACKREVARWRPLLAAPLDGLAKLPAARGKLVVKGDSGTPDPPTPEADLSTEVARGAVVVTSRDRARVEIGMVGESETSRMAPTPNRRARLGLAVLFEPSSPGGGAGGAGGKEMRPVLERLELEIPGEATIVHPSAKCECKLTTARVEKSRGGEVALGVHGVVTANGRSYRVEADLTTFVRDVVKEQDGSRALPPVHPTTGLAGLSSSGARPGLGLDAGARR